MVMQQLATKDFWTQHLVHIALYLLIKILTKEQNLHENNF